MAGRGFHILATLGLVAPIAAEAWDAWGDTKDFARVLDRVQSMYTGYDMRTGQFVAGRLAKGLLPLGLGVAGSTLAAKFKVNRFFPKGINL